MIPSFCMAILAAWVALIGPAIASCVTPNCVQVQFAVKGDGTFTHCILGVYNAKDGYSGMAYSAKYAQDATYGNKAFQGNATTKVMGHRYPCSGTSDCKTPGLVPVSGLVVAYTGEVELGQTFTTECTGAPAGSP